MLFQLDIIHLRPSPLISADHTDCPPAESRSRDDLNGRRGKISREKRKAENAADHGNTPTHRAKVIREFRRQHNARSGKRKFHQEPTFKVEEQRPWMQRATSSDLAHFPLSESTERRPPPGGSPFANSRGPPSLPYLTMPPPAVGPYLYPFGRVDAVRYGSSEAQQPFPVPAWIRPWTPFPGFDGSAAPHANPSFGPFVGQCNARVDSSTSTGSLACPSFASTHQASPLPQGVAKPKDIPTV